jgi:hypothetical protein
MTLFSSSYISGNIARKESRIRFFQYSSKGFLERMPLMIFSALPPRSSKSVKDVVRRTCMISWTMLPRSIASILYSFISGGSRWRTLSIKNFLGQLL